MLEDLLVNGLITTSLVSVLLALLADIRNNKGLGVLSLLLYSLIAIMYSLFIEDGLYIQSILGVKIPVYIDALSRILLLLSGLIGLMISLYISFGSIGKNMFIKYTSTTLSIILSGLAFTTGSWLFFIVLWESIGFLVYYNTVLYKSGESRADYVYYVTIHLTGLLVLIGIGLLYHSGVRLINEYIPGELVVAVVIAVVGLIAKSGLFPYHYWVQMLYENTDPLYVSIVSGLIDLLGVYGVARLLYSLQTVPAALQYLLILVVLASMYASAVWYWSCKSITAVLAWSSIYNSGWMILGVFSTVTQGLSVSILALYMLAYGLAKSAVFLIIRDNGLEYWRYRLSSPITALLFSAAILGVEGVPPFTLFIARLYILSGIIAYSWILALLVLPAWVSSTIYFYKLFADTFFPTGETRHGVYRCLFKPSYITGFFIVLSILAYPITMLLGGG